MTDWQWQFQILRDMAKEFERQAERMPSMHPMRLEADHVLAALDFAKNNADDTLNEDPVVESSEYWKVAYDSIAWTAPFREKEYVRDWFTTRGYRW